MRSRGLGTSVVMSRNSYGSTLQADDQTLAVMHTQGKLTTRSNKNPCYCSCRVRRLRSKGAILVLIWNVLLFGYLGTTNSVIAYFALNSPGVVPEYAWLLTSLIEAVSMVLLYPFAGWLADVYFGRYKIIQYSMWLMWIGMVAMGISLLLLHYLGGVRGVHETVFYCLFPVTIVIMQMGMAGTKANLIVFGIDQLQDSSADELNAFIAWYAWVEIFGLSLVMYFCGWTGLQLELTVLIHVVAQAACVTAALCLDLVCRKWLITDPETPNPLRIVVRVIKYAAQNKVPRQRSAFTYCETDIPSRIDFAKKRYGGPFTAEQVEDVKTFFRLLLVMSTFFGYYIGGEDVFDIASHLNPNLSNRNENGYCVGKLINLSAGNMFIPSMIIFVPFYEFIVYPWFHHYVPTMLKRIGFGMVLILGSTLSDFVLDTVGHATTSRPTPCLFMPSVNDTAVTLDIGEAWFAIPSALSGLSLMAFYISTYQFVLAQTPYSMKGLMIGILYLLRGVFNIIRTAIILAFRLGYSDDPVTSPSCGFWYYLLSSAVIVAGLVVFCAVARHYKRRQRGEQTYTREYVESYYERSINEDRQ